MKLLIDFGLFSTNLGPDRNELIARLIGIFTNFSQGRKKLIARFLAIFSNLTPETGTDSFLNFGVFHGF